MERIKIIDNFLDDQELLNLKKILDTKEWKNKASSGGYELIDNKFFSAFNIDFFFLEHIKTKIETSIIKKDTILKRHYMHIQTFGQDGGFHVDGKKTNGTEMTFCLYITDLTSELLDTAGGDLVIKIPNQRHLMSIKTIMNRGILFPSQYFHKGNAYTSNYADNRLCLTWKLEIQ